MLAAHRAHRIAEALTLTIMGVAKAGVLAAGGELVCLEARTNDAGVLRVRYADGWVRPPRLARVAAQ